MTFFVRNICALHILYGKNMIKYLNPERRVENYSFLQELKQEFRALKIALEHIIYVPCRYLLENSHKFFCIVMHVRHRGKK